MTEIFYGLIMLITVGAVAWIFFPENFIKQKLLQTKNNSDRALTEDALKHLHDCEERNLTATVDSLAGNLHIPRDKAALLITRLGENKLIEGNRDGIYRLTKDGRLYALRVIRTHRLWERYLADETGTAESAWHTLAEKKEHELTIEQTNELAAKLGNPIFDPHGDPIPLPSGEVARRKSFPLTSLALYETGQIFHIEDEPDIIYAQIVALGLYPGMHIRLISADEERIRFEANGEECVLSPQIAASISVSALNFNEKVPEEYLSLAHLKTGEKGKVVGIAKALRGQQRRRLMDLGVVPGSVIEAKFSSPAGDPIAYIIRGAVIALRRLHASYIFIEKIKTEVQNG